MAVETKVKPLALYTIIKTYVEPILRGIGAYIGKDGYIRPRGSDNDIVILHEDLGLNTPRTEAEYIEILDSTNADIFNPLINKGHMKIIEELMRRQLEYIHREVTMDGGLIWDDEVMDAGDNEDEESNIVLKKYVFPDKIVWSFVKELDEDGNSEILGQGYDPMKRELFALWMCIADCYRNLNPNQFEPQFKSLETALMTIDKLMKRSEKEYKTIKNIIKNRVDKLGDIDLTESDDMDLSVDPEEEKESDDGTVFGGMNLDNASNHEGSITIGNMTKPVDDLTSVYNGVSFLLD